MDSWLGFWIAIIVLAALITIAWDWFKKGSP
jgi:hypothetical protein